MRSVVSSFLAVYCMIVLYGLFACGGSLFATGFQVQQPQYALFLLRKGAEISATTTTNTALFSSSSYLDSLGQRGAPVPAPPAPAPAPAPAAAQQQAQTSQHQHYYAPLEYFAVQHMKSKGPRTIKDWGTPQDATRSLAIANDDTFFVGAWYCSQGGWPSAKPKAHTEIFYVLDGHGALGDIDGVLHYFGPGDTVIIPKGHVGRWDVNSATGIHKVWAVHEHLKIEEVISSTNPVIRVQVIHYHQLSPQFLTKGHDALYASCTVGASCCSSVASQTYYNVGPNKVGVWTSTSSASCPSSSSFIVSSPYPKRTWFFMLEGVLFITDGATGMAHRCVPGDTVMIPQGWTGRIDVVEGPVKKIWATAEVE